MRAFRNADRFPTFKIVRRPALFDDVSLQVNRGDLIKRLRSLGWEGPEYRSDHPFMLKEGSPPLKIPNPHSRDISVDLLTKILKQANISRSEWLRSG